MKLMKLLLIISFSITGCTAMAEIPDHERLRPPRAAEQVLGAEFMRETFGMTEPSREISLPYGFVVHTVKVPWVVDGQMTQVYAYGDLKVATRHLGAKGLKPIRVNGKAVVVLTFLDYKDSGGGPYEEFVLGIMAVEKDARVPSFKNLKIFQKLQSLYGSRIIEYVEHLTLGGPVQNFLSFQHAIWAGRVSISYPKYYGRIRRGAEATPGEFKINLNQPEVAYFKQGQSDSKKAGSMKINFNMPVKRKSHKTQKQLLRTYYASHTEADTLCRIENQISVDSTDITHKKRKARLKVEGNSSTARLLQSLNLKVEKVVQGDDLKLVLYPEQVTTNGCRAAKGLTYDYKDFYPEWLVEMAEKLFVER